MFKNAVLTLAGETSFNNGERGSVNVFNIVEVITTSNGHFKPFFQTLTDGSVVHLNRPLEFGRYPAAPNVAIDFVDNDRTYIYGVAIGFGF